MNVEQNVEEMDDAAITEILSDEDDNILEPEPDTPSPDEDDDTPPEQPVDEDTPPADDTPAQDDTPPTEVTVESLQAELEEVRSREQAAQNRINDKESFIQRQANELGELRKQTKVDPEELRNQFDEDPVAAVNKMAAMREAEDREAELEQSLALEQNRTAVLQAMPDFDGMVGDIADLAATEGATPADIAQFKTNPYGTQAALLINMANRVKANKRIATLEAEVASQKQKAADIVGNIAKTAKTKGRLSGASKGAAEPTSKAISETQLADMSDEELKDFIKNN